MDCENKNYLVSYETRVHVPISITLTKSETGFSSTYIIRIIMTTGLLGPKKEKYL